MAMNHLDRLLRLARRTGDRLIVTDERGSEEPLVILPLDEYEALVDGALGPGEGVGSRQADVGGGEFWVEPEAEIEDIQLNDETVDDLVAVDSLETGDPEASDPDEAEIDEEALKSLWEPAKPEENDEKSQKIKGDEVKKSSDGEEGFYLESID